MKMIDLTCPKCSATLKPNADNTKAVCEYCGYQVLIEREDTVEEMRAKAHAKSYGYHKGKLEAEAEVKEKATKRQKARSIKIKFIVAAVVVLLILLSAAFEQLSKPQVNPFDCIEVTFQGTDGEGKAVLQTKSTADIDVNYIDFVISKKNYLLQGETITVTATSDRYLLTEKERVYTVEGLDEYLTDLEDIPADALEMIHLRAESALELNLDSSKSAGFFLDMKPVKLFLTTDGKQTNSLYDVFEVRFTTVDGEKTFYVMAVFSDVVVRDGEQTSINMSSGVYSGNLTQVQGWLYIMAYNSLEEIKASLLTSQESQMELKELDLQ